MPTPRLDVVLEIDVQGAAQVRAREPEALLIFLEAPSPDAQRQRLRRVAATHRTWSQQRLATRRGRGRVRPGRWARTSWSTTGIDDAVAEIVAIIEAARTPPDLIRAGRSDPGLIPA